MTIVVSEADRVAEWTVEDAYVGVVRKLEDVFTEDGQPVWEAPIECSGGWAEVATVCGDSERLARVRGEIVAKALRGAPIPNNCANDVERLCRSDNEADWITAETLQCLSVHAATARLEGALAMREGAAKVAAAIILGARTGEIDTDLRCIGHHLQSDILALDPISGEGGE